MKNFKIIFMLSLSLMHHAVYAQVSFSNYALTGVTIIDANHRTPLLHQTVLITHNIISGIFIDGSKPIPDSFNIMRMEGKYLLPGLIDTHVHLATDPTNIDNRANTLDVLQRMLYSGITSVRDMAGDARTLASLSRDALTGDIISPDIYYSALIAGPDFFKDPRTILSSKGFAAGNAPFMRGITDTTNLELAVANAKGTGATGIKLYADLSAQLSAKIIAEAKKQGLKVWGHAWLQQAKPSDLVKAGINSISHSALLIYDNFENVHVTWGASDSIPVPWSGKHDDKYWDDSIHINTSLFKLMKENNTILDATMIAFKQAEAANDKWYVIYQIEKRLTAEAYKAGVKICTGTDDDQTKFVQSEIELLVNEAGFSNIDALIAATKTGAEAIGIEDTRGTIERDKIADLVVLDKNPLEKIENIESVYLVIKNGAFFKR